MTPLTIGPWSLDARRPCVIAEIGINHDGDLTVARRTIDAAAAAGADAVKFQTFHAEEFMADRKLVYEYETATGPVRESMYEMFKRLELPEAWHVALQTHAAERGVAFLSSCADPAAVELLGRLDVPALKLASEDLINLPLLRCVGATGRPVIVSTGMAEAAEIDRAMETLRDAGAGPLVLLHCVSLYPTPDGEANLRRLLSLRERYHVPVGYSDHTRGITAAIGATALGAVMIEKHFTLDRSRPGPDHAFSADPDELARLVEGVRAVARQLGAAELQPAPGEGEARVNFRRGVVAAQPIPRGVIITETMLSLKRPARGIAPHQMAELIGCRTVRSIETNEPLRWELVE